MSWKLTVKVQHADTWPSTSLVRFTCDMSFFEGVITRLIECFQQHEYYSSTCCRLSSPLFRCSCQGNMKVVYGKSKHQQRSAPSELPLDDLPEILELEELLCEANPNIVNAYLIRKNWGSGQLQNCWENGKAHFLVSDE